MAKMTTAERKRLPKKDFGLPGKVDKDDKNKADRGAYPMPDKKHAAVAKAYASKEEARGKLSKSAEEKIDAKADRVIKGSAAGRKKPKPDPVKVERSRRTM